MKICLCFILRHCNFTYNNSITHETNDTQQYTNYDNKSSGRLVQEPIDRGYAIEQSREPRRSEAAVSQCAYSTDEFVGYLDLTSAIGAVTTSNAGISFKIFRIFRLTN
jgi:hypothetical protein